MRRRSLRHVVRSGVLALLAGVLVVVPALPEKPAYAGDPDIAHDVSFRDSDACSRS